jgi:hypothetical protein
MNPSLVKALLAERQQGVQLLYGVATGTNTVEVAGSSVAVQLPALETVVAGDYVAVLAAGADRLIIGAVNRSSSQPVAQSSFVDFITITGSFATLPFQAPGQIESPAGAFTITNAAGTIEVTAAGLYLVMFEFAFSVATGNAANYVHAYARRNSTDVLEAITDTAGAFGMLSSQILLELAAGDTVSVRVATTNGSAVATRGGRLTVMRP